jgi:hypothetical protein
VTDADHGVGSARLTAESDPAGIGHDHVSRAVQGSQRAHLIFEAPKSGVATMTTEMMTEAAGIANESPARSRHTLPQRRHCETFDLHHGNQNSLFAVTLGYYGERGEGGIGEVFISGAKAGSEVGAVARDGAVLLSIAIQFGVPLETIQHALTREANGAPSTIIGEVVDRLVEPALALQVKSPTRRERIRDVVRQAFAEEMGVNA